MKTFNLKLKEYVSFTGKFTPEQVETILQGEVDEVVAIARNPLIALRIAGELMLQGNAARLLELMRANAFQDVSLGLRQKEMEPVDYQYYEARKELNEYILGNFPNAKMFACKMDQTLKTHNLSVLSFL